MVVCLNWRFWSHKLDRGLFSLFCFWKFEEKKKQNKTKKKRKKKKEREMKDIGKVYVSLVGFPGVGVRTLHKALQEEENYREVGQLVMEYVIEGL